jgi:Co/Zn/Cd efflux system component
VEIDDDFEAFRARFPSARDAVAECENPTWLVRIAFDAAKDKKSIIRSAAWAKHRIDIWWAPLTMFIPIPEPFEALERWTGETTAESEGAQGREWNNVRAVFLPVILAWLAWILIATAHLWTSLQWHRTLVASLIAVGVIVVGSVLMKRTLRWILRSQVARLNAKPTKALDAILWCMEKNPERMRRDLWSLRDKCLEVLDSETAFQ